MKKLFASILSLTLIFSLAACGNTAGTSSEAPVSDTTQSSTSEVGPEPEPVTSSTPNTDSSSSSSEAETASSSTVETESSTTSETETESSSNTEAETVSSLVVYFSWSGNTKSVATEIQNQTGADLFELVPAEPYTDDYNALLDIAQDELANSARPGLSGNIGNLDNYDVVYIGYPCWWGDMPMLLYTFFDSYDLSGKTIVPFVTSGGSGFSGTISSIQTLEPDATMLEGLSLSSSAAASPAHAVSEWLGKIGLAA